MAARIALRDDIPAPSTVKGAPSGALDTDTSLNVLLYQTMREQGVGKADLARRLGWHAPQVDRLLSLNHSSRTGQLDQAFAALGRRVQVAVEDAT